MNLETARRVVAILEADEELIQHVADRPGHDRRYAIDCAEAPHASAGRRASRSTAGLRETVEWYRANEPWWRAIQAGADYAEYVAANYGGRAGA